MGPVVIKICHQGQIGLSKGEQTEEVGLVSLESEHVWGLLTFLPKGLALECHQFTLIHTS